MSNEGKYPNYSIRSAGQLRQAIMTQADRRAHEVEVARMTEEFLANGGEINVAPEVPDATDSRNVGMPARSLF